MSAVKLPTIRTKTAKRKRLADELPDNLTSENGIRMMGLKSLEKAKSLASKERKARERSEIQGKCKEQRPEDRQRKTEKEGCYNTDDIRSDSF